MSDPTPMRPLWSVDADVQATLTLSHAVLRALIVLSPMLISTSEAGLEAETLRAARTDRLATQRVLDILQDLSGRFQRALVQAEWEAELEAAIIEAAARLPLAATPPALRQAC